MRSIIRQGRKAGVACFVKQLGAKPFEDDLPDYPAFQRFLALHDRKGGDMSEWPEDLRVRQFPEAVA